MNNINVLLIAIPSYSKGIIEAMHQLGYKVFFIPAKPNEGAISKTLGRLKTPLYKKVIENYYKKEINKIKGETINRILVLRGEYTPIKSLKLCRSFFPNAKMILYMWDSLKNCRGMEKKWPFFDAVYTFDRIDYLKYSEAIRFLPLFYYENYLPKSPAAKPNNLVSFIGTAHEDRIPIVNKVFSFLEEHGYRTFKFFYLPHKIVFLKNKLLNKHFRGVRKSDLHFSPLAFEKLYSVYNDSMCVLDIESSTQSGLTMRTIELIGLHKKIITTNKDIVNYDFYNENNIMVIDRKDPKIDLTFFEKPYIDLEESIYEKYSLSNWIKKVLEE